MKQYTFFILILFALPLFSQNNSADSNIDEAIEKIKTIYITDTREMVFDISTRKQNDTLFISGSTVNEKAFKELLALSTASGSPTIYKLKLLPDKELKDTLYGVVNVSVADMRTQNKFTSGMATQSLLGTPVKILERNKWYRIQLPDTYLGWVHERQIVPMNKIDYNKWLLAPKVIFKKHYGFAYSGPDSGGETVSDLVAGNILKRIGVEGEFFKVEYPDKRIAYVKRTDSDEYAIWQSSRIISPNSFVEIAKSMQGIPYMWGGTSTKGMDCSGLVSTVMRLHGLTILRDASQQATLGASIDISDGYSNLQAGDLMFFGAENNIRHVGFYLGDNKFIHASGWTRISSLDPDDENYDELNAREFVKARRIVDKNKLIGVDKMKDNSFYQIQR